MICGGLTVAWSFMCVGAYDSHTVASSSLSSDSSGPPDQDPRGPPASAEGCHVAKKRLSQAPQWGNAQRRSHRSVTPHATCHNTPAVEGRMTQGSRTDESMDTVAQPRSN
ncbi:hypothetical protein DPEC_G00353070 [Dallia pectoralis]|uniref:Uncharacterized protein n=1 Tax=Dallia pectoralis TaxID=75939 RepID=A0ACC2F2B8_DALPE|nr:hypothetical protein DPEC_G00353070 [Dallia pectoralis]